MAQRFGPYVILEPLGEGGVGRVHLARHIETGAEVALKTPKGSSIHDVTLFRREVALLAHLSGKDAGLVSLVDCGLAQADLWYAMEYIAGPTLADYLELDDAAQAGSSAVRSFAPETSPLLVEAAASGEGLGSRRRNAHPVTARAGDRGGLRRVRILADVAGAVCVLHENGIVHGDLTPANVMLQGGERAVLVDFGSSSYYGRHGDPREVVHDGLATYGTKGYSAPELEIGSSSGPLSDLYSLGCLMARVLSDPTSPIGAESLLSEFAHLAPVVRILRAAKPEARTLDARRVQYYLREYVAGRQPDISIAAPNVHLRPAMVGRGSVLHSLMTRLSAAEGGAGGCSWVIGEPGSGKTRVLNEVIGEALRRGFRVCSAVCPDPQAQREPLRSQPAVTRALAGPGEVPEFPSAELSEGVQRARVLNQVFSSLESTSSEIPVLLVLDDMHWADDTTRAFVQSERLAVFARLRVMLIASSWPGESRLAQGYPESASETLRLSPLSEEDVRNLLQNQMGSRAIATELVRWIFEASAGNPLHATELIRHLLHQQAVTRDAATGQWRLASTEALPKELSTPSLREWVDARLRALDADASKTLRAAALLGGVFSVPELKSLLDAVFGQGALRPEKQVRGLEASGLFRVNDDGTYSFSNNLYLRGALAIREPATDGQLAAQVANYLASRTGQSLPEGRLGYLWTAAGAPDRAFACFVNSSHEARSWRESQRERKLLDLALEQYDKMNSESQQERAVEAASVHSRQAELCTREGRAEDADAHYRRALELGQTVHSELERASLMRRRARAMGAGASRRSDQAEASFRDAEALMQQSELRGTQQWYSEWIEIQLARFWLNYYERRPLDATLAVLESQVLANGSTLQKSDLFQCTCARLLAASAYSPSPLAADYAKRALLAIEQDAAAAERLAEAQMIAAFALLWLNPRDWMDAVALMGEAEKGALWFENNALLAQVRTYLAIALRRLGRTDSAEQVAAVALTTAQRCGSPGYIGAALATQAWVAWKRGALTQAEALVREARQSWKDGSLRHPFQCFLNFVWADLLRLQERFEEAQQRLTELLAPDQHRLPDALRAVIATACGPGMDAVAVDRALSAVSRAAAVHAYL